MFNSGNRYVTRGVDSTVPLYLMMIMWNLIDRRKDIEKLDYLQIFRLSVEDGQQVIIHEQEQPMPFKNKYTLTAQTTFVGKVYVIDDGDHETMLLAEEY